MKNQRSLGTPRRWENLTSAEIAAAVTSGMDMAILPVGATEQHGPHLATGCDTAAPDEIARLVSARTGVLVLPALSYGISLGHTTKWAGTISLHPQTFIQAVLEIGRWAVGSGIRRLLFLNGNGPNVPGLECARIQLRYEFPRCRFRVLTLFDLSERVRRAYYSDAADLHANRGETSLLMHLRPEMVRPRAILDEDDVSPGLVFSYDMPSTTRSGVTGRPSESSPRDGAALTEMLVSDLTAIVRTALVEKWPKLPGPRRRRAQKKRR
jgi:creatinine amidohydrolase